MDIRVFYERNHYDNAGVSNALHNIKLSIWGSQIDDISIGLYTGG